MNWVATSLNLSSASLTCLLVNPPHWSNYVSFVIRLLWYHRLPLSKHFFYFIMLLISLIKFNLVKLVLIIRLFAIHHQMAQRVSSLLFFLIPLSRVGCFNSLIKRYDCLAMSHLFLYIQNTLLFHLIAICKIFKLRFLNTSHWVFIVWILFRHV